MRGHTSICVDSLFKLSKNGRTHGVPWSWPRTYKQRFAPPFLEWTSCQQMLPAGQGYCWSIISEFIQQPFGKIATQADRLFHGLQCAEPTGWIKCFTWCSRTMAGIWPETTYIFSGIHFFKTEIHSLKTMVIWTVVSELNMMMMMMMMKTMSAKPKLLLMTSRVT